MIPLIALVLGVTGEVRELMSLAFLSLAMEWSL